MMMFPLLDSLAIGLKPSIKNPLILSSSKDHHANAAWDLTTRCFDKLSMSGSGPDFAWSEMISGQIGAEGIK
jgi:hypothetical protein